MYNNGDSIIAASTYSYNSKNQLIKELKTNSKGEVLETNIVYPEDKPADPVAWRMLQTNDIHNILEQSEKVNGELVSKRINHYQELSGEIFVPSKTQLMNTKTLADEDAVVYHQYDSKGNVLSFSRANGTVINYIWSYAGKYPVAEIKGPAYQDIVPLLGGTNAISTFSNLVEPSKVQVDSFLSPIRDAIASNNLGAIEITSFSYDSLLGITSETDPAGRTTFYEYDSFGRLKLIKDDKGAIKKKIDYNYRNN